MPVTLYCHLTWTTHRRELVLDDRLRRFLRRFLPSAAERYGAVVIASGFVRDHLHLILWVPPVIDIPRLVQGLKGASARIANRDGHATGAKLRWAKGYDLRSVSPRGLQAVLRYVERQEERHPLDRMKEGDTHHLADVVSPLDRL